VLNGSRQKSDWLQVSTALQPRSRKKNLFLLGGAVGVAAGIALIAWPNQTFPIEIIVYTAMIAVPIFRMLLPRIRRRRFWLTVGLLFVAHGLFLWLVRSLFPFKTVLALVPYALLEVGILALITIKSLGPA